MKDKRVISFFMAFFLICSQPFIAISYANNNLTSSETGSVGNADDFITASGSISGTVSLSGYLSASGIYLSASAGTFSDVEIELGNLWDAYRSTVQGVKDLADYTGSVVRGGYVLAKNAWNAFGGFARWLQQKFHLSDNQSDVNLSDIPVDTALLSNSQKTKVGNGYIYSGNILYFSNGYIQLNGITSTSLYGFYYYRSDVPDRLEVYVYNGGSENVTMGTGSVKLYIGSSATEYYNKGPQVQVVVRPGTSASTGIYIQSNKNSAFITSSSTTINPPESPELSILNADTSVIDIPDDIPDNATGSASLGGVLIPAIGAGLGGAAGSIAGAIIDGVMGGVMPDIDIKPADVNIPPNMEIDDDGNVLPKDLEFRPTDVFLDSDSYKLDTLNNYFPFSIPWDLLHFAAMFRAEPEIPIINFILPMPEGIDDIVINVDLTPFEPVAALSRSGLFVLFAIRWLMFLYRKFG